MLFNVLVHVVFVSDMYLCFNKFNIRLIVDPCFSVPVVSNP